MALATSRVFCMLAPGSVQAGATPELAEPPSELFAVPAAAALAEQLDALAFGVLLAQPATARPAVASRAAAAHEVRVTKCLTLARTPGAPPDTPITASEN